MHKQNYDDAHDIDVIMPMYNLTEYSDKCSKKHLEFYDNIVEINPLR